MPTKFNVDCTGNVASGVEATVHADLQGRWSGASYWVDLFLYDSNGEVVAQSYDARPWPQTMQGPATAIVDLHVNYGDASTAVRAAVYVWKWADNTVPVSNVVDVEL